MSVCDCARCSNVAQRFLHICLEQRTNEDDGKLVYPRPPPNVVLSKDMHPIVVKDEPSERK